MRLSTHVLDTALGRPAAGVSLVLLRLDSDVWRKVGSGKTDAEGRCRSLLGDEPLAAATYCIHFATAEYFEAQEVVGLYPYVDIVFTVRQADQHYHVPLLLTANGYSTYRGT